MNHNFDFQGCQKMHIRVAISQKGLIGLFANCCHLMLLGPKEWKHKSKVLRTHFKNFFIPGTLWREKRDWLLLPEEGEKYAQHVGHEAIGGAARMDNSYSGVIFHMAVQPIRGRRHLGANSN